MARTLILIRHAKSSWDDTGLDDHARTLNARGRGAAPAIGRWLAEHGHVPQVMLCSDAARTRETAALILPHLIPAPDLQILPRLYHASPDIMIDLIQKQTASVVGLIGHNPGIGLLAAGLVKHRPAHPRFADYPTCATVVIRFHVENWGDVTPQTGHCEDFVVPGDLIT